MQPEIHNSPVPLLEMCQISKAFPGVRALHDVSLKLYPGEVLALLGENGAGKSTLIRTLGGAHHADSGEIVLSGETVDIKSPIDAQRAGISIIHQEFNLIPEMTVRENIFLGRETSKLGFVNAASEHDQVVRLFEKIGLIIDPESRCADLTVAQQQTVEIARALSVNARLIVMDEPSAALTIQEVEKLFAIIRDLKNQGIGIIYISHRLEEIFEIADRVMVLRDGIHAGTLPVTEIDRGKLIRLMVGRSLDAEFPTRSVKKGEEILRVNQLTRGQIVRDVSFSVKRGEVLGFAGLIGSGRTEIMRLIFGADKIESGEIFINDRVVKIENPRDAISNRICLLTEDRKGQGLVLIHSCQENFGLPNLNRFRKGIFLDSSAEANSFSNYVRQLQIKITDNDQPALTLSGGNQQKVVLAKWLAGNADIIIFDEPTRGIDVGAKYEIYLLINELAAQGKAIILVSSELPEIIGMCDRIMVMHRGQIKGEIIDAASATQEDILTMAIS